MNLRNTILWIFIVLFSIFSNCTLVKSQNKRPFRVKDAYYQSWNFNQNDKGTNVFVVLTHVKNGITFDSLIFRGHQVPVFSEKHNDSITLKAIISVEIPKLLTDSQPTDKPDQLIYTLQSNKFSFLLPEIRREQMKYH